MVTLITIVFIFLAAMGVLFAVVPFAPSILYMVIVMTIYALVDSFEHVTVPNVMLFLGIFLISIIVDNFIGIAWARYKGASFASLMWGMLGVILGFFIFPPIGAVFGMFIGVFLSEFYHSHNAKKAFKIAEASVIGQIIAVIINVILAMILFSLFIFTIFL